MTDQNNVTLNADGGIDIPVRIAQQLDETDDMIKRLQQEERETSQMVQEYEERYSQQPAYIRYADDDAPQTGQVVDMPEKAKNDSSWWRQINPSMPPRHRYPERPLADNNGVSDQEKNWAAIAHATSILTLIFALVGPTVVLPLLIPLGIYLINRSRSNYVAFHALQAFTLQVVGTVGAFLLGVVGSIVLSVFIVLSAITIIGIPIALLLTLALVVVICVALSMPIAMVIYGCIAAYAASKGRAYRYPYIADWVDDQLNNGFMGVRL